MVGRKVIYKDKVYEVIHDYGNGFLEIKDVASFYKVILVAKVDVIEKKEVISRLLE